MAFKKLQVFLDISGARVICWDHVALPGHAGYVVQRSYSSAEDDWTDASGLLTDVCAWMDTDRLWFNKMRELYYRVQSIALNVAGSDSEPGGSSSSVSPTVLETSCHELTATVLHPVDMGLASSIMNSARIEIENSGMFGWLLKRRHWGNRCPVCSDFGTGESVNPQCQTCAGTGREGGYYRAIPLTVLPGTIRRTQQNTADGYSDSVKMVVSCLASPLINADDLWVANNTNDRYLITQVNTSSELRGVPLVLTMELSRMPTTSVTHTRIITDKIRIPSDTLAIEDALVTYRPKG